MNCVAGYDKGHGGRAYPVISGSFITFGLTKHDGGWNFSLLSSFFLSRLYFWGWVFCLFRRNGE